jgi:hypothetical protein
MLGHELEHIVTSFIDHTGVIPDEKDWFPPFRGWEASRPRDISRKIRNLHSDLGGDRSDVSVPANLDK